MTVADDTFTSPEVAAAYEAARGMPGEQKSGLLAQLESAKARERVLARYKNVVDLARAVNPNYVVTPALEIIGEAIEGVLDPPPGVTRNLLVTMPPQEGKSTMCAVYTPLRALQRNPNRKIVLVTYGAPLAYMHSTTCRDIIRRHGSGVLDSLTGAVVEDKIGFKLARGANRVSEWMIDGADGGLVAVGIGGPITGRPADLMIIDDPYKNMMEADSQGYRDKVDMWFSSVVHTRLAPGAPIILIQTRWHPDDLSGAVLRAEATLPRAERSWKHINIPAISEAGLPDALKRPEDGIPMVSARDTDEHKRDFPAKRKAVGERTWYALYQGSPRNPAGGLFMHTWFDDRRLTGTPIVPVASIVGIDPADSGDGDETGIIGAMLDGDGTVVLAEDWSGQFTSDEWSTQAVLLALQMGAREIAMESYTTATTYAKVIERAWVAIHAAAVEKYNAGGKLTPVEERALVPQKPFTIHKWKMPGDAVARSALLRQACEVGRCRTVEFKLGVFEAQACDWQAGQHQPDRVAAAIIAHDRLAALGSGRPTLAAPVNTRPLEAPAWMRRRIGGR